ncbi:MBL fold metallo-hydrolase [Alkalihalobacillus sp. LMS39]|uniref:MBL fold metallo-hydrolase n=1 Tax=Alkalihalobacillus sp. LMS39 TaxID=2924032 RepID=UPI001FB2C37B|nr:MBL fold metallo-hydrolase [Alkalihalobacillus sp. LMS39]UOE96249.1 MBL fold metallo-hydrolase [Alkalihalobacillus sp. LMS39]
MIKNTLFLFLTFLLSACTFQEEVNIAPEPQQQSTQSESTDTIDKPELIVHYIDVGQADATLFEYSSDGIDYRILIDAGNWNRTDVLDYLDKNNITHLDILIGTHPHADHIGQIDQILMTLDVGEVWMSGEMVASDTFSRVLDALESTGVSYHEPRAGDNYDIGPLILEIVNPEKRTGDVHKSSISLRAVYGDVTFMFTGDAEHETENEIINNNLEVESTFLQLGHHGSNTSTSSEFLKAINPEVAIYSAGSGNSYGHPHQEVIDRVLSNDIALYGTDIHGTIIVRTNGTNYDITSERTSQIEHKQKQTNTTDNITACINLNQASLTEIEQIIHIGENRAANVIELRPIESLDELTKINGIGPARLADILEENKACIGGE